MMRRLALTILVLAGPVLSGPVLSGASLALLAPGSTAAAQQDVVTTAKGPPAPQPLTPAESLDTPDRRLDGGDVQTVHIGPCTPYAALAARRAAEDGARIEPDRSPHGEVEVAAGNHGYREAHAIVCHPIGDHGAVTISISKGEFGRTPR